MFSIITISTTGFGEIIPKNNAFGKNLVFSEIVVGILLLVIFFGVLTNTWKSKNDGLYRLLKKAHIKHCKIYEILRNNK